MLRRGPLSVNPYFSPHALDPLVIDRPAMPRHTRNHLQLSGTSAYGMHARMGIGQREDSVTRTEGG